MTRKDYQLLASHIGFSYCNGDISPAGVRDIADALECDNPRFNRNLFFDACGVDGDV